MYGLLQFYGLSTKVDWISESRKKMFILNQIVRQVIFL